MAQKTWILIKSRDEEVPRLDDGPLRGRSIVELTTQAAYVEWMKADSVWVHRSLTKLKFKVPGAPAFTLPARGV